VIEPFKPTEPIVSVEPNRLDSRKLLHCSLPST
jgi:hypothetical protein